MEGAAIPQRPTSIITQAAHSAFAGPTPGSSIITVQKATPTSPSDTSSFEQFTTHSQRHSIESDGSDSSSSTERRSRSRSRLKRPTLGSRKSSGTIIIPRDSPTHAENEEYDQDDARAMSPRRTSDEIDKMGDEARHALEMQSKALQENLLEIIERVDSVKSEHEKLDGDNKFLQSYIGELMQTSKLTAVGASKNKKRGAK